MEKQIYLRKVIENECIFRKGLECSNCGYCSSNTNKSIKRTDDYYDYDLQMMFHRYIIPNNKDLKVGDIIELTFEDENDTDSYNFKIVKKDGDALILTEYYQDYCKVNKNCVAFDRGVKAIDAIKELGVIL